MSEPPPPPPRAHLTLPGGHRVEVGVLRRVQRGDGWRYVVELDVPAAAVARIDGEDYSAVPTVREAPAGGFVLVTTTPPNAPPSMELHTATCWGLNSVTRDQRLTPVDSADVARAMLTFGDTTACTTCVPEP